MSTARLAKYSGRCVLIWSQNSPESGLQSSLQADTLDKHTGIKFSMKPGTPPLQSTRLLDQLRERIPYMHYSLSTEKAYLYWVRFFIRWHGRNGQMKHPRTMGAPEIEAFLTMLATERKGVHLHAQSSSERLAVSVPRSFEHGFAVDGRHQSPNGQAAHTQCVDQERSGWLIGPMSLRSPNPLRRQRHQNVRIPGAVQPKRLIQRLVAGAHIQP